MLFRSPMNTDSYTQKALSHNHARTHTKESFPSSTHMRSHTHTHTHAHTNTPMRCHAHTSIPASSIIPHLHREWVLKDSEDAKNELSFNRERTNHIDRERTRTLTWALTTACASYILGHDAGRATRLHDEVSLCHDRGA